MGRKILLADDSITIQKVVNLTFSDEGIEVVTVGNGELAIRKLADVRPDIVLADIYMPGKNGYEVCEYVKTNPQFAHLPVLLLVGAFEPFDQSEAARVKADGHLTKPFESRALVATVTRLLAQAPPAAAPPMATPVNAVQSSWHTPPPDATTTRLSPELIASLPMGHSLPKVEPIKASPVPASEIPQPTQALFSFNPPPNPDFNEVPIDAAPKAEIQTTQVLDKDFSLPALSNFAVESNSELPTFELNVELPPTSTPAEPAQPEDNQAEADFDMSQDFESTRIMGSPLRNFDIGGYSNSSSPDNAAIISFDASSPLELDDLELQPPAPGPLEGDVLSEEVLNRGTFPPPVAPEPLFSNNVEATYSTIAASDNQYDEITSLDELEPLEDYSTGQAEVLELAEPLSMEELPSIDAEDVLETEASDHNAAAKSATSEPVINPEAILSTSHTTGELDKGRITSSELEPVSEEMLSSDDGMDMMPAELQQIIKNKEAEPIATFTPQPSAVEEDRAPVFDLSFMPQGNEVAVDPPAPAQVSEASIASPLFIPPPLDWTLPTFQTEPETVEPVVTEPVAEPLKAESFTASEPISELPTEIPTEPLALPNVATTVATDFASPVEEPSSIVEPPSVETAMVTTPAETEVASTPTSEPANITEVPAEPSLLPVASAVALGAVSVAAATNLDESSTVVEDSPVTETKVVAEPSLVTAPAIVAESVPPLPVVHTEVVTPNPVVITSIDQIPQHLIDEIVQRTISQMTDQVVREIVWEVVPDLAEILINKHLQEKTLK